MSRPAIRTHEQQGPLELPLPRGVWRRIIRCVTSEENLCLRVVFKKGKAVSATVEKELELDE